MPYNNDPSLPYWKSNVDVYDLYKTRARRHDDDLVKMRGTFLPAILVDYTYDHTFQPDEDGDLTHVVPVFKGCRIVDIVAIGENVWAATTGHGKYLGTITGRVYDTPAAWLAGDSGVLPLAKSF
jgi:hypothetical protein